MYTENGLTADLNEVRSVIRSADVFGIGFRLFGPRLLVDTRTNSTDGAFIAVVPPLSNLQERIHWLGRQRPSFRMPERFAFFFWPHSIRFFEESGIWDEITGRMTAGEDGVAPDTASVIAELRRLEHDAMRAAVSGEDHRTLWVRPA